MTNSEPMEMRVIALGGLPLIGAGDDLAAILAEAVTANGEALQDGDVLVIAQKIVSKAEGRYRVLDDITPSARAVSLAEKTGKDPRLVELILSESRRIVRQREGVLIVEHNTGIVMANAGIDASNVETDPTSGAARVLLLPADPDASCTALRDTIEHLTGTKIALIINDSVGRAWRNGTIGIAIGAAGIDALLDLNGEADLFGRPLQATQIGVADELAAAASLIMGQAGEGRPAVLIRGFKHASGDGTATDLIRPAALDLFR
jgi:coenzyme F420-0:L-glutamate ligase/coenzyme F420-1:gamma-L-glutamate ligase